VVIEGLPAGVPISPSDIAGQLARRQAGHGRGGRMRIERDAGELLSGVRLGESLGSPLSIWIPNRDFANWELAMAVEPQPGATDAELRRVTLPRPGHADLVGMLKYDRADARDVLERSSARETAARVAAGAIARRLLIEFGVSVGSHVVRIGPVEAERPTELAHDLNAAADESSVRCLDSRAAAAMVAAIDEARDAGDTLGGVFEVVATGLPVGLGSHVSWSRRLDSRLAAALMGIQAMKGVEIGLGFDAPRRRGSDVHDEILPAPGGGCRRSRNHSGGIEGGMTTAEDIVVRVAMKPISTLRRALRSIDVTTGETVEAAWERSDTCAAPAAGVIAECVVALVLADALLEKTGGDSMTEVRRNLDGYRAACADLLRGVGSDPAEST